jgi:hypothetical protein
MNLRRWLSIILMMGLILALNSLTAQAGPKYHHPRGNAYGWDGPRPRGFDRHHKNFRRSCRGPHNPHYAGRGYGGPPPVAYVVPVAPVMGIPYAQPQYSQSVPPGLSGQFQYNF